MRQCTLLTREIETRWESTFKYSSLIFLHSHVLPTFLIMHMDSIETSLKRMKIKTDLISNKLKRNSFWKSIEPIDSVETHL